MITPQIDGGLTPTTETKIIPSKTYKLISDILTTEVKLGNKKSITQSNRLEVNDVAYTKANMSLYARGAFQQETREYSDQKALGEDLTLTDVDSSLPNLISILGNSKQETSKASKNILDLTKWKRTDIKNVIMDKLSENELIISATNEESTTRGMSFNTELEAGTYYISADMDILEGSGGSTFLQIYTPGYIIEKRIYKGGAEKKQTLTLEQKSTLYFTFTISESGSGGDITGLKKVSFSNLMISKEDIDYVPFTPKKPSIDYLSENKSCGDDINLFDGIFEIGYLNGSTGGVEHLYDNQTIYTPQYIEISAQKCYIKLFNNLCNIGRIVEYDLNKNFIKCTFINTQNYGFNLQKNTKYIRFGCSFNENTEFLTTSVKAKVTQNGGIHNYSPYGQGSIEFENSTPNLYDVNDILSNQGVVDENGWITFEGETTANQQIWKSFLLNPSKRLKTNTDYWLVMEVKERSGSGGFNSNENSNYSQIATSEFYQLPNLNAGDVLIRKVKTQENFDSCERVLGTTYAASNGQKGKITFRLSLLEAEVTKDNFSYVPYGYKSITIPTQQPFRAIEKNKDTFIFQNGKWYENHIIKRIESYSNEEINTEYVSNTGELSEGAVVDYVLYESELIECTEEQTTQLNKLNQLQLYDDTTRIYSTDEISPIFDITYNIKYSIPSLQIPATINNIKSIKVAVNNEEYNLDIILRQVNNVYDILDRGTIKRNVGYIASYNNEDVGDNWKSSTGELSKGAEVIYALKEPIMEQIEIPFTEIDLKIPNSTITATNNLNTKIEITLNYYDNTNVTVTTDKADRIIGYVDKVDALKQAIYHILSIERYSCLIYDENYGVELEQYIGKGFDYLKVTIEETLKEALLQDERILDVVVNNIEKTKINTALIEFTVTAIYGDIQMEVEVNV